MSYLNHILTGLIASALSIVISFFLLNSTKSVPNFAVFNIDKAIESISEEELKYTTDQNKARKIVINAASKVNHWLETRGVVHCPYPCVIFKSKDVVMGDIIDLDAKFNTEVGSH